MAGDWTLQQAGKSEWKLTNNLGVDARDVEVTTVDGVVVRGVRQWGVVASAKAVPLRMIRLATEDASVRVTWASTEGSGSVELPVPPPRTR